MRNLSQHNWPLSQIQSLGHPRYETGALTTLIVVVNAKSVALTLVTLVAGQHLCLLSLKINFPFKNCVGSKGKTH
jgi:hypothetical protein